MPKHKKKLLFQMLLRAYERKNKQAVESQVADFKVVTIN